MLSIIRDSLNNVRRHARAKNIKVSLGRDDENLFVAIADDGQGFDVPLIEKMYAERGSIGLLNMKEWAETVGGLLSVDSSVGHGTKVSLTVPLFFREEATPTLAFEEEEDI